MKPTHIIIQFKSQNREDLYRADDGMLLASRQAEVVRFGSEPKETGARFFLDSDFASLWIRKIPGFDIVSRLGNLTLADVIENDAPGEYLIEERNGESTIILPSGGPVQVLRN